MRGVGASSEAPRTVAAVREVEKRFGNTIALRSVDLQLRAGEVHVLLGENGAGKSTLGKVLAGIYTPDRGHVEVGGHVVVHASPRQARRSGIEIVHQETTVVPQMTVLDNVTLGSEDGFTTAGFLSRRRVRDQVARLLAEVAPGVGPDRRLDQLSGAQRHLVAVARALFRTPKVLIFDEATAALDLHDRLLLFGVIRRIRDGGAAVLYITHHLDEVAQVGDRVTIMRDGASVAECRPDASEDELVEHIVGQRVSIRRQATDAPPDPAEPALEVRGIGLTGAISDLSFTVGKGEVLGVYGVGQSGVDALADVLAGAVRPDAGDVLVGGRPRRGTGVSAALRDGVAYLPGERGRAGIVPTLSVQDNISLSNLGQLSEWGWLSGRRTRRYAEQHAQQMRVRGGSLTAPITTLSGGNQQKALLARALGCHTPVLILKDPTVGVDVGSRAEIYEVLRESARTGTAVIVLTADLPELLAVADRVVVLYRGRLAAALSGPHLQEDAVLEAALGAAARPVQNFESRGVGTRADA